MTDEPNPPAPCAAFSYPLTPAERQQVATLLRFGQSCMVGDYRLYANAPDAFIESDDAYGQPVCWSRESAAEDALQWVDDQYAHDDTPQPAACPSCAGRRVVPSTLVMEFIAKHGIAAFQVGHAIRVLEEDRFGGGGYDPGLYSEAGFDAAVTEDLLDAVDAYQLHACPACAPGENADAPRQQAKEALASYLSKISVDEPQEGAESA